MTLRQLQRASLETADRAIFDGSARCPVCPCIVMVRAGKSPRRLRRALAVADHVLTLHVPQHWSKVSR